ncbi:MAG: glycosyltransferase [Eubacteriales bacterium]|jgi:glycosyltransferase involved in cell wall biosynthesis
MIAAVVPVKNEAATIRKVIKTVSGTGVDLVIPVFNGCTDKSREIIETMNYANISPIHFESSLGIDVPRSVGAAWAYRLGAEIILFIDGDMEGNITDTLRRLLSSILRKGLQMALTDCYPPETGKKPSQLARYLLNLRSELNRTLGFEEAIGNASPSHGPHAITRKFVEYVPYQELAIPPVALALAARCRLNVGIGARLPHAKLGSRQRDFYHNRQIVETIIGDCLEALQVFYGHTRTRTQDGKTYLGYHTERRFDLLEDFLKIIST